MSNVCIVHVFSYLARGLPFHFLNSIFEEEKHLTFMESSISFFFCVFQSPKRFLPTLNISPILLQKVYIEIFIFTLMLVFIVKSVIHLELIFVFSIRVRSFFSFNEVFIWNILFIGFPWHFSCKLTGHRWVVHCWTCCSVPLAYYGMPISPILLYFYNKFLRWYKSLNPESFWK